MAITTLTGLNGTYKFNAEDNSNILGKGGMGIVYKGADQNNQPVAIKVMHRAISAHIDNIEQAKREAAIQIKHKNLIRMLDFIEKGGDHHIVSEFIDGETLRNKLDKSPHGLNQQLSTDITTNILEGLEILHSYNVVHRDIDPSNIMICKDGTAKLMDFGIAKISGYDLPTLTGTGAFKGKSQYAAPEQIKGEKNKINNTTDIYAVGITFYEMLSGILPFNGDSEFDLMKKHIEDPLPTNNKIPNNLFGLITKATAKNQIDRYKSATEFLEDLGHEKPLKTAKEYFERASKFKEAKNWEKAIENYEIVIAKNVKFEDAHFNRANCYSFLGQNSEAIVDYSYEIQNYPDDSSSYHNRAVSYDKIGKISEALADYKQAIKINPDDELYKKNYALFLETNNLHQQLIDDISEEIELNPKDPELYLQRAFGELDSGNKKRFKADVRLAKGLGSKVAIIILISHFYKDFKLIGRILCFPLMISMIFGVTFIMMASFFPLPDNFNKMLFFPYDYVLFSIIYIVSFGFGFLNLVMGNKYLFAKFENYTNSSLGDIKDIYLKNRIKNQLLSVFQRRYQLSDQYYLLGFLALFMTVIILLANIAKWIFG